MDFVFEPAKVLVVALFGMIFGSFTTVLAYRIPRDIPLGLTKNQRSQCPQCHKVIPWYENIPIFAYIFLKGRCSKCHTKIPIRYLMIEIFTTLSFVATFLIFENSPKRPEDPAIYWLELIKLLIFDVALVATIFIDIEFRIIPDRFSLGGWVVALAAAWIWGIPSGFESLLGGLFGAGSFFLLAWSYEKIKGVEGLGMGDVKMMGWLGSWLGIMCVPFMILTASLTGLVIGLAAMAKSKEGFKTAIPFGPFLAIGAYFTWILNTLGYF